MHRAAKPLLIGDRRVEAGQALPPLDPKRLARLVELGHAVAVPDGDEPADAPVAQAASPPAPPRPGRARPPGISYRAAGHFLVGQRSYQPDEALDPESLPEEQLQKLIVRGRVRETADLPPLLVPEVPPAIAAGPATGPSAEMAVAPPAAETAVAPRRTKKR
jgi:hypothetical protein